MNKMDLRIEIDRALRAAQISGAKYINGLSLEEAENVIIRHRENLVKIISESEPKHESQVI